MTPMATMASMVASMAPMAILLASMTSMEASMASMASVAPMALMALASVALQASMVWVTALKRRKLRNEVLRFSPLKTFRRNSPGKLMDPEARDGLTLSK